MDVVKIYNRRRKIVQLFCVACFIVGSLFCVYYIKKIAVIDADRLRDCGPLLASIFWHQEFYIVVSILMNLVIDAIMFFLGTAICDHIIMQAKTKERSEKQ